MRLHWHRRDLRIADTPGIAAASADEPVCGVFVFDPTILEYAAPARMRFMLDALTSLRESYRSQGSDLLVAHGDPSALLPDLVAARDVTHVSWGDDYSGLSTERDRAVIEALEAADVSFEVHTDAVLHEPGEITTNAGDHYSVYTYFWKKWRDRAKTPPYPVPDREAFAAVEGEEMPSLSELGFDEPDGSVPEASTEAARERLATFLAEDVTTYEERRDDAAADATSRLSPHLTFGTIGIRELFSATVEAKEAADSSGAENVEEFQSQLAWREFYLQVLADQPSMTTQNISSFEHEIEWRDAPAEFEAWCEGRTGVPIVDAGMRQLREEHWMHNRLRMIVASFLTKDLLIDWRRGYDWFRQRLVDHDAANDAGGWQWAASTGTDAVPYFRVFNPWTQGERFDEDATYIKRYVPELGDVDPSAIHEWHELDVERRDALAPDYPAPIVDHAAARERAIETFERARGE